MKPAVLVTGAAGFIGKALCRSLLAQQFIVRATMRRVEDAVLLPGCQTALIENVDEDIDWHSTLAGMDSVVHLAARVHMVRDSAADSLTEFRKVNVRGTLNLARQAAAEGVRRFLFISSIKVNGEYTVLGRPFTADDPPAPVDPYGVSKREAEDDLRQLAVESGMEVVIIRPPLVYGPGVKANFLSMMRWLNRGIPLPLGAMYNQRSLVALDNLVNLIVTCIEHPAAANQIFLVSDGEDLSTTELLKRMGRMLGRPARLLPIPPSMLELGAAMLHKRELSKRLCRSLQVDITKTRACLNWSPPMTVDDALSMTARHFLSTTQ